MKRPLTILAATTALGAAIGVPAWSAMRGTVDAPGQPFAAVFEAGQGAMPLILASGDDDDDHQYRNSSGYEDDDDREHRSGARRGDDDDDCDGRDDDDDDCAGSAQNAAPAGTVSPPKNGLFGNGKSPTVQMN